MGRLKGSKNKTIQKGKVDTNANPLYQIDFDLLDKYLLSKGFECTRIWSIFRYYTWAPLDVFRVITDINHKDYLTNNQNFLDEISVLINLSLTEIITQIIKPAKNKFIKSASISKTINTHTKSNKEVSASKKSDITLPKLSQLRGSKIIPNEDLSTKIVDLSIDKQQEISTSTLSSEKDDNVQPNRTLEGEFRDNKGKFTGSHPYSKLPKNINSTAIRSYRAKVAEYVLEAIETLVDLMRTGEHEKTRLAAALKIIEMVIAPPTEPKPSPIEQGVDLSNVDSLPAIMDASVNIIRRMGTGDITSEEAKGLLDNLLTHNKVIEIVEVDPILKAYKFRKAGIAGY